MVQGKDRPTVLLVEDETLVAMIAEAFLGDLGFATVGVLTGADALSALEDHPHFGLAIIDIGLPDMRGDTLVSKARDLSPGLPIVLATGYDAAELGVRFSADPTIAILGKPYSQHDLGAAVAALGLVTTV